MSSHSASDTVQFRELYSVYQSKRVHVIGRVLVIAMGTMSGWTSNLTCKAHRNLRVSVRREDTTEIRNIIAKFERARNTRRPFFKADFQALPFEFFFSEQPSLSSSKDGV